jgi:ABC-type transport system involved in multi-copper enzyme maturation permease subunit
VAILSVFVGSTLVYKEIEKQTILTLLARPVTRSQFLVGKFLGLTFINVTVMIGLALILAVLVHFLELKLESSFLIALIGIFLEGMILTATSLFFGSFAKPITTVIFTASIFLLGHWVRSLDFFIGKSDSESFKIMAKTIRHALPDLERFNWRSAPIYNQVIPTDEFLWATVYGSIWILALIALCVATFRRRDFV